MTGQITAYVNARLLDPESSTDILGGLLVRGQEIAAFGPDVIPGKLPKSAKIIDCSGHCLAPGLIDSRVFIGEPGAEHKETIASASDSATAGGVTTMIMMPNTQPVIDDIALAEYVLRRGVDGHKVNILPMAAATKELEGHEMTEIGLLTQAGAVGFTDGRHAIANAAVMQRILSYSRCFDALIVQHAEEPTLATGSVNTGEISTRLGLGGVSTTSEVIMIERDLRLLAATGGRYHVSQVSCRASLDVIRRAKAQGLKVTCGVTPPHFSLNENAVGDYRTYTKVSPPLREESDRRALIEGLADGTIDLICSGHDPQDAEEKRLPFEQAAHGAVGLETLLPLSLELYHNGLMPLLDVLALMTIRPARILKLPSGRLAPGAPADLVMFDLDRPYRIDAGAFLGKSRNTPFDEHPTQGKVLRTVVAGRTVFEANA
jgi:dihydroorotase